jgi:hypothetical protein
LEKAEAELAELKKAHKPGSEFASKRLEGLERTQKELMAVLAGYCTEIDRRILVLQKSKKAAPLENTSNFWYKVDDFLTAVDKGVSITTGNFYKLYQPSKKFVSEREKELADLDAFGRNSIIAEDALKKRNEWRRALSAANVPEVHEHRAPEREAMWLFDGLAFGEKYDIDSLMSFGNFFADHVHDSMAGFEVAEYKFNGYGIAKFRRLFYGNNGDNFAKEKAKEDNKARGAG